jgi:hypothetical protein
MCLPCLLNLCTLKQIVVTLLLQLQLLVTDVDEPVGRPYTAAVRVSEDLTLVDRVYSMIIILPPSLLLMIHYVAIIVATIS